MNMATLTRATQLIISECSIPFDRIVRQDAVDIYQLWHRKNVLLQPVE
jgi:hypothetical protein